MPKTKPEMMLIDKFYDLMIWTANHVGKFPRVHKFTLGDRLQVRLYEMLDSLLRAKFNRDRVGILRDVNMQLEMLRFQYRIAKDLRCLSLDSYGYASRSVNEVGKLVGAWMI